MNAACRSAGTPIGPMATMMVTVIIPALPGERRDRISDTGAYSINHLRFCTKMKGRDLHMNMKGRRDRP